ncbi:TPA: GNAT family N-acetyltransferase, partial [Methanosarcina acetivorans]
EKILRNVGFTNINKLKEMKVNGAKMYGLYLGIKQEGFVAIEKANDEIFNMERLAVHPDSRHRGYGGYLIDFVVEYAKQNGGKKVSIGIINENERLKNWYRKYGFEETGSKKFEHMSFTVCFMEKVLL